MPLNNLPLELFAIAVILAAGAAVFCAVVRDLGHYARWERIAYCYPLGLAALGTPMFLLSYFGVHLDVVVITGSRSSAWWSLPQRAAFRRGNSGRRGRRPAASTAVHGVRVAAIRHYRF